MAEASSRLDINLEASGKINNVMFISIFEVSKNWKESEEVGSVADLQKQIWEKDRIFEERRETDFITSSWICIDLALFS